MKITVNISPCPNDTFMFEAMLHGRVDTEGIEFEVSFADIEQLNAAAIESSPQVSKISCAVLPAIHTRYAVLDSGSALGRGNGPLMVGSRPDAEPTDEWKVAIPGEHTTACLLMRRFFPQVGRLTPVLFSQIAERVSSGEFDAGVLIHEGRFTYRDKGLHLIADLGQKWDADLGIPLPLGSIVVSRTLPAELQKKIERVVRRSIAHALANPGDSAQFVAAHARELSSTVVESHIRLFVNDFSVSLAEEGRKALTQLTGLTPQQLFL